MVWISLLISSALAGPVPMFTGGGATIGSRTTGPYVAFMPEQEPTGSTLPRGPRATVASTEPSPWQQRSALEAGPGKFVPISQLPTASQPIPKAKNALESR